MSADNGIVIKKNGIKISTVHELMLVSAVRDTLDKKTYLVPDIVDYIIDNYDALTNECKRAIVKDIKEAIGKKDLGSKCDEVQWMALKRFIERGFDAESDINL